MRCFIGRSKDIHARWRRFKKDLKDGRVNNLFSADYLMLGESAWEWVIENECSENSDECLEKVARRISQAGWKIYNLSLDIGKEKTKTVLVPEVRYAEVKPEHKKVFDYFIDQLETNPNFVEQFRNFMFGKTQNQQYNEPVQQKIKSVAEYLQDKRDCCDEDDYKKWMAELDADTNISFKDKTALKKA